MDPMARLEAAVARLPSGAAFTGLTALWLHGVDVDPCNPIEFALAADAGVSGRSHLLLRRSRFDSADMTRTGGLSATRPERAVLDACRRLSLTEAVVVADATLHCRRVTMSELVAWGRANTGRHGIKKFRRVIELAEPASESPMETRLRMLLINGGLPRPQAQVEIYDETGRFVGRPDLYYESRRLGIEYDGGTHRESLADDDRRQNLLLRAGVRLLRFTARDVLGSRDDVVRQVRDMLTTDSAGTIARRRGRERGSAGRIEI
jgi:very-short-patch-repair endonuclease